MSFGFSHSSKRFGSFRSKGKRTAGKDSANEQNERLGIRIISVSIPGGVDSCYVKVSHELHKAETPTVSSKDGLAMIDYLCSLKIEDPEDSLLVELKSRKKGILSSITHVIGSAAIEIKKMNAVESCRHGVTEPYDFNLIISGVGKEALGEVKMQVIRVFPPKPGPNSFVSAFIGTWNVGNAAPDQDLSSWLQERYLREVSLVVIGCQECKYKEREGFKDCEDDFMGAISAVVGKRHSLFRMNHLGEMRLLIFARLDAVAGIQSIEWAEEAVGVGHVMANKGALAAALFLWDTSLCFVNSHLAAHQDKCKRRNEDFAEIVAGMSLGYPNCGIVNQFHHCVWMGDLNYRLDFSHMFGAEIANARSPTAELFGAIKELVAKRALDTLLQCDQLCHQRESGKAFKGFSEGLIRHVPTFKVERQQGVQYQDERAPAYCDRILWRSLEEMEVRSLDLWAGEQVASSDHKPVGTVLQLRLRSPRPEWWPRVIKDVDRGAHKHSLLHHHHVHHDDVHIPCWRVRLVELSGQDLTPSDLNGKADPYIAFLGDALTQWAFTEVQYSTLEPEWKPSSLPSFTLAALSEQALKEEYIVLQAMDHDRFDPDDAIGTGVLALRELLASTAQEHEQAFAVELLQGGKPAGVIRGKLRITEVAPMTINQIRRQRHTKQRFEPHNLCCCNLCVYRNPFKASDPTTPASTPAHRAQASHHRPPPSPIAASRSLAAPAPSDPPAPALVPPPPPAASSAPHGEGPGGAIETVTAPHMRRFEPAGARLAGPPEGGGGGGGGGGWGGGGLHGPAVASGQHSSLPLSGHRVPDSSFDPVRSAAPVYPTRLGPGQFIPARHPVEGRVARRSRSPTRAPPRAHAAAPAGTSPNAHFASFRAPTAEFNPESSSAVPAQSRLPGPYDAPPVYVPPWERAGFEPPTVLSSGAYNKSLMYDSHYPPPRFRGSEAAARP